MCEDCSKSNASYFIMLIRIQRCMLLVWQQRLNLPTNITLHIVATQPMAAEGHSDKMAPAAFDQCLLDIYGYQTMDVVTVRWWVGCFNSGDGNVKNKPCFRWPCRRIASFHCMISPEHSKRRCDSPMHKIFCCLPLRVKQELTSELIGKLDTQ
mgnify:CR=1 FL=1